MCVGVSTTLIRETSLRLVEGFVGIGKTWKMRQKELVLFVLLFRTFRGCFEVLMPVDGSGVVLPLCTQFR